jgi:hypothetical protein
MTDDRNTPVVWGVARFGVAWLSVPELVAALAGERLVAGVARAITDRRKETHA